MSQKTQRHGLDRIDAEKRATLRKLAAGTAFVAPVVLSFPLSGLSITDARAYVNTDERTNLLPIPGDPSDDVKVHRDRPAGPSKPTSENPGGR